MPVPLLVRAAEVGGEALLGGAAVEGTAAVVGTTAAESTAVAAGGTAVEGAEALTAAQRAELLRKAAAAAAALAAAQASTCLTCKQPNPKCDEIYQKIQELTKKLSQRRGDMLADPLKMYNLFLKDPSSQYLIHAILAMILETGRVTVNKSIRRRGSSIGK